MEIKNMAVVSLKQFIEAGVHFGHQTRRWNPKMEPYIYGAKHGIHIIDLRQTLRKLKIAYEYTRQLAEGGKSILFVGTKDQARDILGEEAQRSGSFFINERWLGGLLTNFETIRKSVARMKNYEELAGPERAYPGMIKKEALQIERKRQKLERSLGGVKEMQQLPGAIFIVDCIKEHIALKEARKLDIPIIAIVDTNCNPEGIDFPIPGNDDAPRAIKLYANVIATAVQEGKANRVQRLQEKSMTPQPEESIAEEQLQKAVVAVKEEDQESPESEEAHEDSNTDNIDSEPREENRV
jgi:small subunit ribosomal protein S2